MWNYYGIHNMMGGAFWPLGSFAMILPILFFGLIIWAVFAFVNNSREDRNNYSSRDREKDSSLTILRERYAKGEIDKKEFEEKKKDLE